MNNSVRGDFYHKPGDLLRESDAAWHVDIDGHGKEWLPKSAVEWDAVNHVAIIPRWLMEKKEIPF